MKIDIGGDRLGSGGKESVNLRNFERSTHDLSYVWKSTAAPGTLIPFLTEVGLPGDTFNINLNCDIQTHPTVGPLFGSYKVQLDVFQIPIRLYNGELHMNKLGIGMKMNEILFPLLQVSARVNPDYIIGDNSQINPSCILSYLNIRGIGLNPNAVSAGDTGIRNFNAIPYLAYAEIYKQYYANKQEEIGVVIHNDMTAETTSVVEAFLFLTFAPNASRINILTATYPILINNPTELVIVSKFDPTVRKKPNLEGITITLVLNGTPVTMPITQAFLSWEWSTIDNSYTFRNMNPIYYQELPVTINTFAFDGTVENDLDMPQLHQFPLENIDEMRTQILKHTGEAGPFYINTTSIEPYNLPLIIGTIENEPNGAYSKLSSQEGLFIKTYQSDLFNNWISTEWIDGDNGINAITAIDTTSGSFTIDTLNLAQKVYNMLNAISISGGTYDDWLNAVYRHDRYKSTENPIYMGSLIKELAFEAITNSSASTFEGQQQALGTLAGKGKMTSKNKGGQIKINVDEPSYIMGIFSLTPRIDYSQGNKWDTGLRTMDDLHKPHLDAIGYQDLITDQMAWWDTEFSPTLGPIFKSAGKQPAWINYMTNVNQTRGNFAEENNEMFMTLNRRYSQNQNSILDLTTYIDPTKFNHIFAQTSLDSQNFWVQIAIDMEARRKMSAKVIPNL